ncbi:MAG: tripartite tricarboxylate transporter TctB family protein [Spirochaetales bacterium]|nr:tripartite tricarboxylate transporter TctB family protein [Spirochaetales bacterium]
MTIQRRDMISGAVFGAGAVALFVYASGFPLREGHAAAVSPGFYPRILAGILVVLSGIQISGAVLAEIRSRRTDGGDAGEALPPVWKDKNTFTLFCITLGALIAYPFVMRLIGFAVTGFLFLITLIYALSDGYRKGRQLAFIAGITVGITVLTYVVFRLFLKVPFPAGMIRF